MVFADLDFVDALHLADATKKRYDPVSAEPGQPRTENGGVCGEEAAPEMARRDLIVGASLAILVAQPLCAENLEDRMIRELDAAGYTRVEVSRTLLGRLRMVATGPEARREIVISTATGTILRDHELRGVDLRAAGRRSVSVRANSTRDEGRTKSRPGWASDGSGDALDSLFGKAASDSSAGAGATDEPATATASFADVDPAGLQDPTLRDAAPLEEVGTEAVSRGSGVNSVATSGEEAPANDQSGAASEAAPAMDPAMGSDTDTGTPEPGTPEPGPPEPGPPEPGTNTPDDSVAGSQEPGADDGPDAD